MTAAPIACAHCPVADTAVCAALAPEDRADFTRLGHHRQFVRGEVIVAAGDPNLMFATLTRGVAKLSRVDADGTRGSSRWSTRRVWSGISSRPSPT